jgi:transcriptional regulator with XRE-family HTH domain
MPRKTPDQRDIEVARRMRAVRREKGLSQEKLGNALGLTFQQVQKYENGTNRIAAGRLHKIAEILGVPVAVLFGSPSPTDTSSESLLELIDNAAALRLVRAYARISSPKLKLALATLAEEIAQQSNGPPKVH